MRVRFHIPDFSSRFRLNIMFIEMLKNRPDLFREGVEIASVYGAFPPAMWNGGRPQPGVCSPQHVQEVINAFNQRGIPLRFTFTNPVIEEKHLGDTFCNAVMKMADNGLNEAIVVSPVLEKYIRENYPKYKLTSSTCKRITDPEKLGEELEKDYHIVVIDYDLNNRFEILEKLPRKKDCELLVNACCEPNCPRRSEHYRTIGIQQIAYNEHIRKNPDKPFDSDKYDKHDFKNCPYGQRGIYEIKNLRTHISPDDIWNKYVPMGFEQFKIEGRTSSALNIIETYMYYMAKPECRDEARFMLLKALENTGVLVYR